MGEDEQKIYRMPLIGDFAPEFKAKTTTGNIHFPDDYKGNWVIFFSHPSDFTPVCTTEFIKFSKMQDDFKQLNTELLGLSVDSIYSHIAWIRTIEEKIEYKGLKNVEIKFPIIEDLSMEISKKYGMIHPHAIYSTEEMLEDFERSGGKISLDSGTSTIRAVFIIDPNGRIRAILYYPMSSGRNMDEVKRLLISLQKSDSENIETPEGWQPGDDVIIPPPELSSMAKKRISETDEKMICYDWFLCFRKENA